jgi:hypothetical protein
LFAVRQQSEVALVGIQRVGARVRSQHYGLRQVGGAQGRAGRCLEREIGEPVVDQIDRRVAVPQAVVAPGEGLRAGDHRVQAMALEQFAKQQELRIYVLLLGAFIHDRNRARRPSASRQCPFFVAEHVDQALPGLRFIRDGREQRFDLRAAGALRARQYGVEYGAAGVGIGSAHETGKIVR